MVKRRCTNGPRRVNIRADIICWDRFVLPCLNDQKGVPSQRGHSRGHVETRLIGKDFSTLFPASVAAKSDVRLVEIDRLWILPKSGHSPRTIIRRSNSNSACDILVLDTCHQSVKAAHAPTDNHESRQIDVVPGSARSRERQGSPYIFDSGHHSVGPWTAPSAPKVECHDVETRPLQWLRELEDVLLSPEPTDNGAARMSVEQDDRWTSPDALTGEHRSEHDRVTAGYPNNLYADTLSC